jgi:hypothetical protein
MKTLRNITTIIAALALVYYVYQLISNPRGSKYEIDKNHHVYYKGDGVTKEDAKKTGDFLKQIGLVDGSQGMDVQIRSEKAGDEVKFSMVFDKTKVTSETESAALGIGSQLSTSVFNGRKIKVVFMDDSMDEFKDLGYAPAAQTQMQTQSTGPASNTNQTQDSL